MNPYRAWNDFGDAGFVRPLLKNTQLEHRPLQVVYDANWQGWNAKAFHKAVNGKGAALVLCSAVGHGYFGGYNPKGWAGTGGARPSVAAFLFYQKGNSNNNKWQKLRKVGGGGLACAKDDPDTGIILGADGLVIPLQASRGSNPKAAYSNLGPYFERGSDQKYSLFRKDVGGVQLTQLKVLTGVYAKGEEIPYAGAVLDFTSG